MSEHGISHKNTRLDPDQVPGALKQSRAGKAVMDLVKPGLLERTCEPNSIETLLGCLLDDASSQMRRSGRRIVREEMSHTGDKEANVSERIMRP